MTEKFRELDSVCSTQSVMGNSQNRTARTNYSGIPIEHRTATKWSRIRVSFDIRSDVFDI